MTTPKILKLVARVLISVGDALRTTGGRIRAYAYRMEIRLVSSKGTKGDAA